MMPNRYLQHSMSYFSIRNTSPYKEDDMYDTFTSVCLEYKLSNNVNSLGLKEIFTHQQASQRWRPLRTTSHILSHSTRLHPGISAPQERCSLESQLQYHSAPCQSETQTQDILCLRQQCLLYLVTLRIKAKYLLITACISCWSQFNMCSLYFAS